MDPLTVRELEQAIRNALDGGTLQELRRQVPILDSLLETEYDDGYAYGYDSGYDAGLSELNEREIG